MTTKTHLARASRVAIAAALMLGTAPAVAQMSAAPEAAVPPAAAAPVPQPTITVPDVAPPATQPPAAATPPMESVPVVQAIPPSEPEPAAPPPAAEERPAPATRESAAAPPAGAPTTGAETMPAAVAPASSPDASAPAPDTLPPPVPAVVEPLVQDSPAVPSERNTIQPLWVSFWAAIILALAVGAFIAFGRRRKQTRASVPAEERPPLVQTRPVPEPVPTVTREPIRSVEPARFVPSAPAMGGLPHTGASVALPRTVPESFEDRDALLKRMIAAKPDRANPFRSRRARAKRAKLILQSLGQRFADGKSRIDLSQYPNNWPELAHRKSAAA